ncbi:fumarate reductase/succinate dehydrogenase flavoprotein domain protein [Alkaliphilus metalliredigens QYMF]|uniref:Urocanate reductase n=1 Tax=Alkaliphilus metalliredigens (strain QYMF) TaxID=293826 RepID=A6TSI2_ALKMQ|nr:FAD-dependent oxidoreductase [Alkaliphilus metalliredigens]ABR49150.1 fumarate reductase/succinate dehydrogenase flavoprotein domain protein [Alkaliphilus metalliredigens QYMF]
MNKRKMKYLVSVILCLSMILSVLTGCTQPAETVVASYTAGTYIGEGQGYNGIIKVEVSFSDDAIESVSVLEHGETDGISDPAIERIPTNVVEGQTLKVDAVTGATKTSEGILEAVSAAVELADGDVEALKVVEVIKEDKATGYIIDREADLLIIGGGAAGLTAANAAIENGVENVIVIEKLASFAGASAVAGGLAGGDSEFQRSLGLTDDTPEKIFMDLMKGGGFTNDARLTWIWSEEMGPTLDWLITEMDVPIKNQFSNFPEHSVQRSYSVEGGSGVMLRVLADKFVDAGGEILMETEGISFTMDGDTVVGAVAKDVDGNTINIKAPKTILATGGFGNNPNMLSDSLSEVLFYGASPSTGEGINMAKDMGAQLQFMDYVKMYPQGIEVASGFGRVSTVHSMLTTQQTGAIYVNKEGKRIIDENADFVSIKDATKEQTDDIIYLVMDQEAWDKWSVLAHGDENSSPAGRFTLDEQEEWFNTPEGTPVFRRGDNIEEVAVSAEIDGDSLKETIGRWNEMVASGEDKDFGRKELSPLATDGTYYIIEQKLRFATTLGGVRITENFEVENTEGGIIPGLYAAGECVGGVHGQESMPTAMLSWAVTSGKLAGEVIAGKMK